MHSCHGSAAQSLRRWELPSVASPPKRSPRLLPLQAGRSGAWKQAVATQDRLTHSALQADAAVSSSAVSGGELIPAANDGPTAGVSLTPHDKDRFYGNVSGKQVEDELKRLNSIVKGLVRDFAILKNSAYHLEEGQRQCDDRQDLLDDRSFDFASKLESVLQGLSVPAFATEPRRLTDLPTQSSIDPNKSVVRMQAGKLKIGDVVRFATSGTFVDFNGLPKVDLSFSAGGTVTVAEVHSEVFRDAGWGFWAPISALEGHHIVESAPGILSDSSTSRLTGSSSLMALAEAGSPPKIRDIQGHTTSNVRTPQRDPANLAACAELGGRLVGPEQKPKLAVSGEFGNVPGSRTGTRGSARGSTRGSSAPRPLFSRETTDFEAADSMRAEPACHVQLFESSHCESLSSGVQYLSDECIRTALETWDVMEQTPRSTLLSQRDDASSAMGLGNSDEREPHHLR